MWVGLMILASAACGGSGTAGAGPVESPTAQPTGGTALPPPDPEPDDDASQADADVPAQDSEIFDEPPDDEAPPVADLADSDADGIADDEDECPLEPETYNGMEDEDGCPDGHVVVEIPTCHDYREYVQFVEGSAQPAARASALLGLVVEVLQQNPQVLLVEVQGYATQASTDRRNERLSLRRALAVVEELVRHGVDPARLLPAGYGARCPGPIDSCGNPGPQDVVSFETLWTDAGPSGRERSCPEAADLRPPLPDGLPLPALDAWIDSPAD